MSESAHHRLDGLEPDNLLAFLALLGLLRALDAARPEWRARAYWDATPPMRPVLVLAAPQSREAVAEAAAEGVKYWGAQFDRTARSATNLLVTDINGQIAEIRGKPEPSEKREKALKKLENKAKKLQADEGHLKLTHVAASAVSLKSLLNDSGGSNDSTRHMQIIAATAVEQFESPRSKGGLGEWNAISTPLKFGSGQMAFVGSLVTLTSTPRADEIERSLFRDWEFKHRGESLRFAPQEARLYALMASDPTKKEKKRKTGGRKRKNGEESPDDETTGDGIAPSERGANSLAALGMLSFPCIPAQRGIGAPGYAALRSKEFFSWPIWISKSGRGWSLAAIEAVLRSRVEGRNDAHDFFARHEIIAVMQAQKFEIEDYYNVTRANTLWRSLDFSE